MTERNDFPTAYEKYYSNIETRASKFEESTDTFVGSALAKNAQNTTKAVKVVTKRANKSLYSSIEQQKEKQLNYLSSYKQKNNIGLNS